MTDWTTCRVVRDRDGDLWLRITGDMWFDGDVRIGSEGLGSNYGPITPVLDADGLPLVRTVGDLTAWHIGRRVRVGLTTFESLGRILATRTLVSLRGMDTDGQWTVIEPVPLDTPCEVLA